MPNPVVSCDRYRVKFFLSFSDNSNWWPGTTGMWIKSRITDFSCDSFLVIEIIWDHKLLKFRWLITEPRCVFCWQTDVGFQTNLSVPGKKKRRGRRKVFLKAFFFFFKSIERHEPSALLSNLQWLLIFCNPHHHRPPLLSLLLFLLPSDLLSVSPHAHHAHRVKTHKSLRGRGAPLAPSRY